MPKRVLVLGAGSQGRVVADMAMALGLDVAGFVELDPDTTRIGEAMMGLGILGHIGELAQVAASCGAKAAIPAIGDNRKRLELIEAANAVKLELPVLIHPHAYVSPFADIGEGSVVCAQAMVGPLAELGPGCIVNTAASVDHDCKLGVCVHIAVGSHLAGTVQVGDFTTFGAGSAAVPGVNVGANVTVGAGATVVKDLPDGCTAVGTPARAV